MTVDVEEISRKAIKTPKNCFSCNKFLDVRDKDDKLIRYEYIKHSDRKTSYFCFECAELLRRNATAFVKAKIAK